MSKSEVYNEFIINLFNDSLNIQVRDRTRFHALRYIEEEKEVYMEDMMDKISKYTGVTKLSSSDVLTPHDIVSDMVDLLPEDIFKPGITFFDPAVKSGRFLIELFKRLMNSEYMVEEFPDNDNRKEYILNNQLYGLSTSELTANIVRKALYNEVLEEGNIIYVNQYSNICKSKSLKQVTKEGYGRDMKFNVIIGNPPYNNDIYLDFVTQSFYLSKDYTVMITPAKWQVKGGAKNIAFRQEIVPHMSKIVFYPDCLDVFAILDVSGICYYKMDKNRYNKCDVINKCVAKPSLNSSVCRSVVNRPLLNLGYQIVDKIHAKGNFRGLEFKFNSRDAYHIDISKYVIFGGGGYATKERDSEGHWHVKQEAVGNQSMLFSVKEKNITVMGDSVILQRSRQEYGYDITLFSSNSIDECKSFKSYIGTKLVKFLIFINAYTRQCVGKQLTWAYVPDPGQLDHIFTDKELYEKYSLTLKEVDMIESLIK